MRIAETLGEGQSSTINLLHGWAMNASLMRHWGEQLAALGYCINLIDLPGHGHAHAQPMPADLPALAALAEAMPDGHWIGWSLGGMAALQWALMQPQRVHSLTLLCAGPSFVAREHWPDGVQPAVLDGFARQLADDVKHTVKSFLALEVLGSRHQHATLRALQKKVLDSPLPARDALQQGLHLLRHSDMVNALKNLQTPSLWLAGGRDRLVHPESMRKASALTGGRFALIRGAGHAPLVNHCDELTREMQSFHAT